jgi:hypothetical protein
LNQIIVMLLFRIALNLCTNMAGKLSKYCGCVICLFLSRSCKYACSRVLKRSKLEFWFAR